MDGYLHCIYQVAQKIKTGKVNMAKYTPENDDQATARIEQQVYPPLSSESVPNTVELTTPVLLTGPNASGKTTILKSTLLNVIMTQQWGCGWYESAILPSLYTHFHSYLNIPDTNERDSLFQAESRRCKLILEAMDSSPKRHFCIFDELYSGTNPKDAVNAGTAFLLYISKRDNVDFILTTHYTDLCEKLMADEECEFVVEQMETKRNETTGLLEYTYHKVDGISYVEGGANVLKMMNYPDEIMESLTAAKPTAETPS
jgi:DNA mismatch repair ATPase MutS